MLPKHLFEGTDIKASKHGNAPVGTGPFKFVEWQRGQFIRLDRNPDYWKPGRPYLDRIVARFVADSATRTAAIEKGEAHVGGFAAIPWPDVKTLAKLPTIETTTKGYEMSSPIVQLDFNTRKAPFDNLKVRQAVSYAVSRKAVIENVWFGWGKPATGPINSNFAPVGFYTPQVQQLQRPQRHRDRQQAARRRRLQARGRRHPLRDRPRSHAVRRGVAALRRVRAAGAGRARHQGHAALRGRGHVAEAPVHRLRLPAHARTGSRAWPTP